MVIGAPATFNVHNNFRENCKTIILHSILLNILYYKMLEPGHFANNNNNNIVMFIRIIDCVDIS